MWAGPYPGSWSAFAAPLSTWKAQQPPMCAPLLKALPKFPPMHPCGMHPFPRPLSKHGTLRLRHLLCVRQLSRSYIMELLSDVRAGQLLVFVYPLGKTADMSLPRLLSLTQAPGDASRTTSQASCINCLPPIAELMLDFRRGGYAPYVDVSASHWQQPVPLLAGRSAGTLDYRPSTAYNTPD